MAKNDIEWALDVMGLDANASPLEVRRRYRELVREFHPDVLIAQGFGVEAIQLAHRFVARLNAVRVLFQERDTPAPS